MYSSSRGCGTCDPLVGRAANRTSRSPSTNTSAERPGVRGSARAAASERGGGVRSMNDPVELISLPLSQAVLYTIGQMVMHKPAFARWNRNFERIGRNFQIRFSILGRAKRV